VEAKALQTKQAATSNAVANGTTRLFAHSQEWERLEVSHLSDVIAVFMRTSIAWRREPS